MGDFCRMAQGGSVGDPRAESIEQQSLIGSPNQCEAVNVARAKRALVFRPALSNQAISPSRRAIATACVRLCAPSFMLMLRRWVRTVLSETNSFSAMALFE